MRYYLLLLLLVLSGCALYAQNKPKGTRNDQMYPPADSAKRYINYDGRGFIINGKHTFVTSGTIHYARVPAALWADRLLRMKRAGFDAVETYAFWNYHEIKENQFDFTGDKDFEAYLTTAQKIGLYAIVRVGPYVCAEWDFGGYPIWIKFKEPMNVRTADPVFLKYNDHWYDKILPMVAKHQINHGGNVIMVQLENEHPLGWGVINNDPYFDHLHNDAIRLGIEVPYFFSGLHHGGPPSIGDVNTDKRTNPWFTTEFWAGWFDAYRTLPDKRSRGIDYTTWGIQAHAAGGYNYYMVHGGSNFETWNDASTGASYDYGTAIGQAGDLRLMYYRMKRANQLAQSFPGIIGNAADSVKAYANFVTGRGIEVIGAPCGPDGTLVYIRNTSSNDGVAGFPDRILLRMPSYSTYPIPVKVKVTDGVIIQSSTLPILASSAYNNTQTLVFYGQPGQQGKISFSGSQELQLLSKSKAYYINYIRNTTNLKVTVPDNGIEELAFKAGDKTIRVLVINQDLSLYTWLIGDAGKQSIVFGSAYVNSLSTDAGKTTAVIERPYGTPSPGRIAVNANTKLDDQPAPALTKWQMAPSAEIQPGFDDSKWLASDSPLQMGADGDISAFCWYRSTINLPTGGTGILKLKFSNNIEVYVNGQHAKPNTDGVEAQFVPGVNTIAILASHSGRDKQYIYLGPLNDRDDKGIIGDVTLNINNNTSMVKGWRMRGGASAQLADDRSWKPFTYGHDAPVFYHTTFITNPPAALGAHPILRANFKGLSRGTIWLNGHNLGRYPEKIRVDGLYLPECWLNAGQNALVVFDESGASPQQVKLEVEQAASREVILAQTPADASSPIVVPQENVPRDIASQNLGNIAYGKPSSASVTAVGGNVQNLTDGDVESAWAAPADAQNPSFTIDLQSPQPVKVAEIYWDQEAKRYKYYLEGSTDGQTWIKLGDQTTAVPTSPDSPSELSRLNLAGDSYRYLRVTITAARSMKVNEFKAYGK